MGPETHHSYRCHRDWSKTRGCCAELIPVCSQRYLPDDPPLAGNPVFSIYQTDIIIYGRNLWDYFRHEFDKEAWLQVNQEKQMTVDCRGVAPGKRMCLTTSLYQRLQHPFK